jgi:hypothetical protein
LLFAKARSLALASIYFGLLGVPDCWIPDFWSLLHRYYLFMTKHSDVLSESDCDNVNYKSYSDFEPEIGRKMCRLSSDSKGGSAKQRNSDNKSDIYTGREAATWQEQVINPN